MKRLWLSLILFLSISATAHASWQQLPGIAKDIGIGADGSVWVIGTNVVRGGFGIHRWSGSNWSMVDGGATEISVDHYGAPWVVNSSGNIYRRR